MDTGTFTLPTVLLLALFPAIGSLIGILLAEWRQPGEAVTGAALHAAVGLATAVAALELIPRAQERIPAGALAAGIVVGSLLSLLVARASRRFASRLSGDAARPALWAAYSAIAVDLAIDGLTTGSGSAIAADLGLLLALSQVVANIPGGFAITARFRSADMARSRRLLFMAAFPAVSLIGAAAGFVALGGAGDGIRGFVLAILAGLLLLATIEDLVPEADRPGAPRRISSPAFAAGFGLLLLISAYLGT